MTHIPTQGHYVEIEQHIRKTHGYLKNTVVARGQVQKRRGREVWGAVWSLHLLAPFRAMALILFLETDYSLFLSENECPTTPSPGRVTHRD